MYMLTYKKGGFMAINKSDVFVGTIKKCINIRDYNRYGDKRFIPDFRLRSVIVGNEQVNTEIILENALLIRTKKGYVYVDLLDSFFKRFLTDRGVQLKILNSKPFYDGQFFVDEKSLIPYFNLDTNLNNEKETISVKKLLRANKNK